MIFENAGKRKDVPVKTIICYECGEVLVIVGRKTTDCKISVFCHCGAVECREYGNEIKQKGSIALRMEDGFICPQCGEILFGISEDRVRNVAFRVRCSCGMIFDKARQAEKPKRKLGTFASIE